MVAWNKDQPKEITNRFKKAYCSTCGAYLPQGSRVLWIKRGEVACLKHKEQPNHEDPFAWLDEEEFEFGEYQTGAQWTDPGWEPYTGYNPNDYEERYS